MMQSPSPSKGGLELATGSKSASGPRLVRGTFANAGPGQCRRRAMILGRMPCAFCDNRNLTNEHVWPDWLRRAAPSPRQHLRVFRRRTDHTRGGERTERQWDAPPYSTRVRVVCDTCNNGWMSQLEDAVSPLLGPMLHGNTKILDRERQALLAQWVFKTTAMLDFTYPQERAIQDADLRWLYEHRAPPPNVLIWVASYRGAERNSFYRHDVMHPLPPGAPRNIPEREHDAPLPPPVSYGVNLGVRHVAFQVFGTTDPHHRLAHAGQALQWFEPLWPVRDAFTWPPAAQLDDQSLPLVLQMFADAPTRT